MKPLPFLRDPVLRLVTAVVIVPMVIVLLLAIFLLPIWVGWVAFLGWAVLVALCWISMKRRLDRVRAASTLTYVRPGKR